MENWQSLLGGMGGGGGSTRIAESRAASTQGDTITESSNVLWIVIAGVVGLLGLGGLLVYALKK